MTRARPDGGVQEMVIDGWHPPQVANGPHGSWQGAAGRRKLVKLKTALYARTQRIEHICGKARVEVVFVYPRRYRVDPDNLAARLKGVLDGLVLAGVLADDDTEHVDLGVSMRVEPGRKALEIHLAPATGPGGRAGGD